MTAPPFDRAAATQLAADEQAEVRRLQGYGCGAAPSVVRRAQIVAALQGALDALQPQTPEGR